MKAVPDSVDKIVLSLISLSCCTCGASSEPNVAVAIKHPPPSSIWVSSLEISWFNISKESIVSSNLGSCEL